MCADAAPGFRVELDDDLRVLCLTGAHDGTTLRALRITLEHVIALDERDLVLDLTEASIDDDTVIVQLVEATKRQLTGNGRALMVRQRSAFSDERPLIPGASGPAVAAENGDAA